jgi:hypothetical protein
MKFARPVKQRGNARDTAAPVERNFQRSDGIPRKLIARREIYYSHIVPFGVELFDLLKYPDPSLGLSCLLQPYGPRLHFCEETVQIIHGNSGEKNKHKFLPFSLALILKIFYIRKVPAADAGPPGTPIVTPDSFSSPDSKILRRFS